MTQNALKTFRFVRLALMASVGFPLILASNAFAQLPAPAVPAEPSAAAPSTAEVERVVVTGSNIPTAEETGPNPVDTYRPQDIEKLGIRNATDLQEFIPQQAGGTVNLNIGDGGDGSGDRPVEEDQERALRHDQALPHGLFRHIPQDQRQDPDDPPFSSLAKIVLNARKNHDCGESEKSPRLIPIWKWTEILVVVPE